MIYTTCYVKNVSGSQKTYVGKVLENNEAYQVPDVTRLKWSEDGTVLLAIANLELSVGNGSTYLSSISEQIDLLKNEQPIEANVLTQPPFAEPTFRTKYNSSDIVTIQPNSNETIDFQLTQERYVYGGQFVVKNAEIGDYVTAEIYDKDGVIPEAYRAALCEAWPSVATYIEKAWVLVEGVYTNMKINTYPLNAKISAGLYMRLTYHATSEGSARQAGITYYFTKKL